MFDFSGKVAVVTGASGGIGAATAELFAAGGAMVVLTDIKSEGEATAARIHDAGGRALFMHHDVTDESGWESVVTVALKEFGGLDILVNNAAVEHSVFLSDIEASDIRHTLDVNVTGTLLGHKHAIRAMRPGGRAGRGGSIVNLSSVAGLIGFPGLGVYSASKGAVRLLSKAAAVECGRLGYKVRVNSVHPGYVQTDMGEKLLEQFVDLGVFPNMAAAREQNLASYPVGRTGVPKDIAQAIGFLASDLASWISGTEIVIDGAMTVS